MEFWRLRLIFEGYLHGFFCGYLRRKFEVICKMSFHPNLGLFRQGQPGRPWRCGREQCGSGMHAVQQSSGIVWLKQAVSCVAEAVTCVAKAIGISWLKQAAMGSCKAKKITKDTKKTLTRHVGT